MAFAITLLNTKIVAAPATTMTSDSVSPSANALLLAVVGCVKGSSGGNPILTTASDTLTGTGAWTLRANISQGDVSGIDNEIGIFTAQAGATPGSGTITVNWTNSSSRNVLYVVEITGHDTSAPVTQQQTGVNASATPSITLGATPATDALVFAAVSAYGDTDGITPGAAFTELADAQAGSSAPNCRLEVEYDVDSAATTCDWSAVTAINNCCGALEIALAAAGESASEMRTLGLVMMMVLLEDRHPEVRRR